MEGHVAENEPTTTGASPRRGYVVEDGRPGRRKTKIEQKPPNWFRLRDGLMDKLDARGWYRQLAQRKRTEEMDGNPRDVEPWLRQITDPEEMDRIMCRVDVVAECKTANDVKIAQFNGRVVVEIDPAAPKDLLFSKIGTLHDARGTSIEGTKLHLARRINVTPWKEHRILALYDLKLMDYDLSAERKQLAAWLFPEIDNEKKRGDKFDRAKEYLEAALASLNTLRAQSTG
jgi:hypothetical protein